MKTLPYQIVIRWASADDSYEATVPALRGCVAYGDTPEEAAREIRVVADLWLEAVKKNGKPIPKSDPTLERLGSLRGLLNLSALANESGVSVQTLASKLSRGTPLTDSESAAIGGVLSGYGIGKLE